MSAQSRPISFVAERAVRYLRDREEPVDSRTLVQDLLATRAADEATARRLLEAALGSDPRLVYESGCWRLTGESLPRTRRQTEPDPDRSLIFLEGQRPAKGAPFELHSVSVIRLQGDEVLAACGGDAATGTSGNRLRRAVQKTLDGAVPVIHDQPGAIKALETWLNSPLDFPISMRRLGHQRLGLPANHDLEALAAKLNLVYRETEDPLEMADTIDACLQALLRDGESMQELRVDMMSSPSNVDWSRLAFSRSFLAEVPHEPGVYQFFDADGNLIYVGKSNNLHQRLGSYFQDRTPAPRRVQRLLDSLHRIEYEITGSALEATLLEAEWIAKRNPSLNVQRRVEGRAGRGARLRSILILEPAAPPNVLRAYLIRGGRLIDRVPIGPRGGGLKRIERVLDDHFFSAPVGPATVGGPDLDVEIVVRWLAENRDKVVALDPTDLQNAQEVIERLRWFLSQGAPFDPDGSPVHPR